MKKTDKVKIKVFVYTGFSNAEHEDYFYVDREKWNLLTEQEREDLLDSYASEYMSNCIEFGAYVEDDE